MAFNNLMFWIFCVFAICGAHFSVTAVSEKDQSALIGKTSCNKGPTYWCESLQNAVDCSAVVHCTQTVWETTSSIPKSEKCSTCVDALYNIRSAVNSRTQQYIVWDLLSDMCNVAGKRSNSPNMECHNAAKYIMFNAYEQFEKLVNNPKISNDVFCGIIGFCIEESKPVVAGSDKQCTDLQEACADFNTAVECGTVSDCMEQNWKALENLEAADVSGGCFLCTKLVKDIRVYIQNNTSSNITRECVERICTLPFVSQDFPKCLAWIDKNYNVLIQLLNSSYTPAIVCSLLGFCVLEHNEKVVVKVNDNIELIVPDFIFNNENPLSIDEPLATSKTVKLLGDQHCSWGPSYWCINITTSAECTATSHCIQSVWSTRLFREDNDDVCKICKDMVQQARDTLKSNDTQEELKEVLDGSCKLIHIKPVVDNCIKLMDDDFIPQLTEMLTSMLNPTAVCSVAGLCNNAMIDTLLLSENKKSVQYKGHKECKHCNTLIGYIQKKFKKTAKVDVHRKFVEVCGEMSSYSDVCTISVSTYFDTIYDKLTRDLEPYKVCHLAGMCAYKYHFHPNKDNVENYDDDYSTAIDELDKNGDLPCDLCKQLAEHLREELVANTTEEEFHQILVGICEQTGKFKEECLNFVNANFDLVYNYLIQEFNSTTLCVDVGLCPRSGAFVTDNLDGITGRLLLVPSIQRDVMDMLGIRESDLKSMPTVTEKAPSLSKTPTCTICEYVLHYIEQILDDPKEQADIEKAVEKVCGYVPKQFTKQCNGFIESYGALIISLLAEEVDPSLVCPELKLCPPKKIQFFPEPKTRNNVKPSCSICLLVFDGIFGELQQNVTEQRIEHVLMHICTRLPRSAVGDCEDLIKHYYSDVIDMITADFSAEEACVFIHVCSASDENLLKSDKSHRLQIAAADLEESNDIPDESKTNLNDGDIIEKARRGKHCLLCKTLLKHFEVELTSNITEAKVEELFNDFCDHLKEDQLKKQCRSFVDKYSERVLEMIVAKVNVTDVCAILKLCQFQNEYNENRSRCQFCEAVIGSLNGILADPYLDDGIVEYVDKVCDIFPKKQGPLCTEIMSHAIPTLESIANQIPPWFICTKIKFCPYNINSSLISNNVGGSPCTWGPAYWCQSKTTAAMCQTTEHCQMYIWKGTDPPEK